MPMNDSQKWTCPRRSSSTLPGEFREPVVDTCEDAEDGPAEEYVVDVGYDEVACLLPGSRMARPPALRRSDPPIKNMAMKPRAKTIGTLKRSLPPQMVPNQLKILTAVGMAIRVVLVRRRPARSAVIQLRTCGAPTRRSSRIRLPRLTRR